MQLVIVRGLEDNMVVGRMVVMVLAMLAILLVVTQVEAGYGSSDMANTAEFASGLQDVDSLRSLYHEDAADEFLDEPTRRMLGTQTYISYGALTANRAPCPSGTAGSSYYSCATTGTVSPYVRPCTQITKCARG